MWPFPSKTSIEQSGILRGFTDWHSHILPGVDDGIRTMEESLAVLSYYEEAGISEVWLTPHIMEDIPNTTSALKARFSELREAYNGPVKLHLAAENMLDNLFQERFSEGDLLPLGPQGNHLLVETSYYNPPMDLYGILENIRKKGWFAVLAHPERYVYMSNSDYKRLKEMGIILQLNLPSLAGAYGPMVRTKALKLLAGGFYSLAGSDIHRLNAFRYAVGQKVLTQDRIKGIPVKK